MIGSKSTLAAAAVAVMVAGSVRAADVEVLHWWTSGSEAAALGVLKETLKSQGIGWQDMPVAGGAGEAALTALKTRITAGNPPSAAQLSGSAVKEWGAEGLLGDLSPVAAEGSWDALVPDALKDIAVQDGKWVAVPVNIHRPNWLWINARIFQDNGLTPPTTWEEFNAVAEELKSKGIVPLAHGGQAWQDTTVFDDVVLGIGGPDFYREAILELDPDALGSETMVKVFDQMRVIRGFVDDNFSGRDWNLATAMVINGQAAMQLMGDWAKGEMVKANVKPGVDILCVPAPGTAGSFLFNSDFFAAFDVSEAQKPAQDQLAADIMGKDFQESFNLVKGAISARNDIGPDKFDPCGQKAMADIAEAQKSGTLLGSMSQGNGQTAAVQRAFYDVVTDVFNSDMTSEDAVVELRDAVEAAR